MFKMINKHCLLQNVGSRDVDQVKADINKLTRNVFLKNKTKHATFTTYPNKHYPVEQFHVCASKNSDRLLSCLHWISVK